MPLKQFCCAKCGRCAPKKYLEHGEFKKRMDWLRHHYQRAHPGEFKKWAKRAVRTKRKRGTL